MITIIFFDYEVFDYDWLVVLIDVSTQQVTEIVNDPEQMQQFYEEHKNDYLDRIQ